MAALRWRDVNSTMARLSKPLAAAATVAAVVVIGAARAQDPALPEGPGKAEFVQVCSQCHLPGMATAQRRDPREWTEVIARMTDFGAVGAAAEFQAVLAYLNANFGTETPAPPAAASPSTKAKPDAR
jgi:mono/diheme cytochrome c family protein